MNEFRLDFIGVGLPKCGTTWVSEMLSLHPDIDFAKSKETFYFIQQDNLFRDDITGFRKIKTLEKLKEDFQNDTRIKGEFSTMYLFDEKALTEIKKHNKNVKIIVCIRPPWEFLYSAYVFDKNSNFGHMIPDTFEAYLKNWSSLSLVKKEWSFYNKYLKYLYSIFEKDQILIIDMKEIKENGESLISKLYSFISVKNTFLPESFKEPINSTMKMRNRFVQGVVFNIFNLLQALNLDNYLHKFVHSRGWFRNLLFSLLKKDYKKQKLPINLGVQLKLEYTEEVLNISKLTGLNLDHWLENN